MRLGGGVSFGLGGRCFRPGRGLARRGPVDGLDRLFGQSRQGEQGGARGSDHAAAVEDIEGHLGLCAAVGVSAELVGKS